MTCIQISQEAGKVVWYSHLLKNFPQFVVIHTVKGFGVVSKAEVDIFSGTLTFSMIQFDFWFLCHSYQLEHLEFLGSRTGEAWFEEF